VVIVHRVRSLYKYEGSRVEGLAFAENLVIVAHPSKSGGPWWYGSISGSGAKGFFPGSYVQILDDRRLLHVVSAKFDSDACLYSQGSGDVSLCSWKSGRTFV
jgi:hypothetical protein